MSRRTRAASSLIAVLAAGLFAVPAPAHAAPAAPAAPAPASGTAPATPASGTVPASQGGATGAELRWAVQPTSGPGAPARSVFQYESGAGTHVDDRVAISNLSDRPLTFAVYATDAYSTADGAFALLPASDPPTDLGTWIKLPRRSWTVPAGKRLEIPFRLTVPDRATPGDHAAGIIAAVTERHTDAQGQQVNLDRRVAARVYLRVDGELAPEVRIEQLETAYRTPGVPFVDGRLSVRYRVRNTGNVRLTAGDAAVRVRGPLGVTLAEPQRVALPELLPGGEVVLERDVDAWPMGRLDAVVTVNPITAEGRLPATSRSAGTWAAPWSTIGALLIVAALVALGWLAWRRRRVLDEPEED
ncbi:DUF916 domain-containing protein [Micromonospora sp. NPDC048999]|uniref:WxL protein peptidoglycan domain-containing protein n=1 Tax=Micromonospora sp. NPDC048999 TaxID=3155391 RepID=UPI00340C04A4